MTQENNQNTCITDKEDKMKLNTHKDLNNINPSQGKSQTF